MEEQAEGLRELVGGNFTEKKKGDCNGFKKHTII